MDNKKKVYGAITTTFIVILMILYYLFLGNTDNVVTNGNVIDVQVIDVGEMPANFSLEKDSDLQIFFFNVGQADSCLVVDNGQAMLIDTGDKYDGKLLVEYIRRLGISRIDYLIGTHVHTDHIGGMSDIIEAFDIGVIYIPYIGTKTMIPEYEKVLNLIDDKDMRITNPEIGEEFFIGGANCIIKYIDNEEPTNVNNSSIIIQIDLDEQNYLFMGDAEEKVEKLGTNKDESKNKINWEEIEVLKVGHHGSSTSTNEAFLTKTSPEKAVISVGKNNDYGHPDMSINGVVERLIKICGNENVYRTDKDGTIYLVNHNGENLITKLETKVNAYK